MSRFLYPDLLTFFSPSVSSLNIFKEYYQSPITFPDFSLMSVIDARWNEEAVTGLKLDCSGVKINREPPFQYVPRVALGTPIPFIQCLAELDEPYFPVVLDMGFISDTRSRILPIQ